MTAAPLKFDFCHLASRPNESMVGLRWLFIILQISLNIHTIEIMTWSREISISLCGYQSYLAYNCPSIIERLSEWTSDWLSAVVKKPWNDLEVPAFQFQCQLDGRQLKSPIWQLCNSPAFYFIFITLWPQTRSKFPQTIPMTKDIKKIPNKRPQKESPLNKV